jgi:hypothetical protein
VAVSAVDEVVVDLVGDDEEVALHRDTSEGLELLPRPNAAGGIVGAAEDEHPARGVDLRAQVVEVHRVAPAVEPERITDDATAVVLDGVIERVIDGRLDDHSVAWLGEGADTVVEGGNDARGQCHPGLLDLPAVAAFEPVDRGLPERRRDEGIAVDAVRGPAADSLDDGRRGLEVHVGHPHRDGVLDLEDLTGIDPLQRFGVRPVDDLVEIVFQIRNLPFLAMILPLAVIVTLSTRASK